jgi:hypothetical protein
VSDSDKPDLERIAAQVLPKIPDDPDPHTEEEIDDLDAQQRKLFLADLQQDIDLRREFAGKIYWLVIIWVLAILAIVVLQGFRICNFELSNSVLLALIGSSTLNIVGLLYVVTHYLFPKN